MRLAIQYGAWAIYAPALRVAESECVWLYMIRPAKTWSRDTARGARSGLKSFVQNSTVQIRT
jgi:hypothetical protein